MKNTFFQLEKETVLYLTFSFFTCCAFSQTWIQKGSDLPGQAPSAEAGVSVSMSADGNSIIIGAASKYIDEDERIFIWNGSAWVQKGTNIIAESTAAPYDYAGYSVGMSDDGNIVVIGAFNNDGSGPDSGSMRVYEWDGSAWVQKGGDIDGEASNDYFGYSVSISGNGTTVAAGAVYNYNSGGTDSGHARVFSWSGSTWAQKGADIDGTISGGLFGYSVSLSSDGNTVAIGAPLDGTIGSSAGKVKVFSWSGSTWIQKGTDLTGIAVNDLFGCSISLSDDGNSLVIGATGTLEGRAEVYVWSGSAWIQQGTNVIGESVGDQYGYSVNMSNDGTTIAVGAINNSSYAGHTRIHKWDGSNWNQVGGDIDGQNPFDDSGISVCLNADGSSVIIGSYLNDNAGTNSGQARVFTLQTETIINESQLDHSVTFSPNPTNGTITIQLNQQENGQLNLKNILGEIIYSSSLNMKEQTFSFKGEPGIYFAEVYYSSNKKDVVKIIKQ